MDRRARKTTAAIREEVLKQMLGKKYSEMTVSEICEAADLSRRTFYLHYRDIDDVFAEIFEIVNQPLFAGIEELEKNYVHGQNEDYELGEIFRLINRTIEDNTAYLTRLATEPSYFHVQMRHISLMKKLINDHLKHEGDSGIRTIYLDYYISGILELYMQWYRREHNMSLDDIRNFALAIIKADRKYFLSKYENRNTGHREF